VKVTIYDLFSHLDTKVNATVVNPGVLPAVKKSYTVTV
jgi:hypothetical protein